jgi:shikimate dehydrogenase
MHTAAFVTLGLPYSYLPFEVPPEELHRVIDGARAMGFGGLNLTVPHKQEAAKFLDEVTEAAERIGAINVVCFADGWAVGHNTDGRGFLDALAVLPGPRPSRAVVLGTGGAGRAIVDALANDDPLLEVDWVSRDPSGLVAPDPRVHPQAYGFVNDLSAHQLLVNATSVGMPGGPEAFAVEPDLSGLPEGARVVDIVYPRPAGGLLDQAAQRGLAVQDGLVMLLWQGVRSLELWLGEPMSPAVVDAMRAALDG